MFINELTHENIFSALTKKYSNFTTITESHYKTEWFNCFTIRDTRERVVMTLTIQDNALTVDYFEGGSKQYSELFLNPTKKVVFNKMNDYFHYVGVLTFDQKKSLEV